MEPLPTPPEASAMPTLVLRFALAGAEDEVSPARHKIVDCVRAWGVALGDDAADTIRLVASELISNAVIHGAGPVTVVLHHRPGRLVIAVSDRDQQAPVASCAPDSAECGRGLALVDYFAVRSGWEPLAHGKRVWAEIELPKPPPAIRAAVLRRFFAARLRRGTGPVLQPLARTAA
ncbi:ATP-binding protein [Streptomyces monticola]|uniref:ATP-binding protein n=1 Tax=Streptomyces monticola TaxID=2666263 RepID=A0ABW2JTC6_9ACTN